MKELLLNFSKLVLKYIASMYRKELGNQNEQLLYQLLTTDFLVIESYNVKNNMQIAEIQEDYKIHLSNFFIEQDEINQKSILLRTILRYFIHLNIPNEENYEKAEFANFITDGFIEVYATELSQTYNLPNITHPELLSNITFVQNLMTKMPKEISMTTIVFQYQYPYLLEMCQINTGINYYSLYQKEYLKSQDYENITNYLKNILPNSPQKENFISTIILACQTIGTKKHAQKELTLNLKNVFLNDIDALNEALAVLPNLLFENNSGNSTTKSNATRIRTTSSGYLKGSIIIFITISIGIYFAILLMS